MSKSKPGKGGNLKKPKLLSKAPALSDNKASDKPVLPSIFTQGTDEKTVECKIENTEAFKAIKKSFGTENPHLCKLFLGHLAGCADSSTGAADNLNQLVPILHDIAPGIHLKLCWWCKWWGFIICQCDV